MLFLGVFGHDRGDFGVKVAFLAFDAFSVVDCVGEQRRFGGHHRHGHGRLVVGLGSVQIGQLGHVFGRLDAQLDLQLLLLRLLKESTHIYLPEACKRRDNLYSLHLGKVLVLQNEQ